MEERLILLICLIIEYNVINLQVKGKGANGSFKLPAGAKTKPAAAAKKAKAPASPKKVIIANVWKTIF